MISLSADERKVVREGVQDLLSWIETSIISSEPLIGHIKAMGQEANVPMYVQAMVLEGWHRGLMADATDIVENIEHILLGRGVNVTENESTED